MTVENQQTDLAYVTVCAKSASSLQEWLRQNPEELEDPQIIEMLRQDAIADSLDHTDISGTRGLPYSGGRALLNLEDLNVHQT